MGELRVDCLGKIDQQVIDEAMASVTRSGSTKLGTGRAIASIKAWSISNFRPTLWAAQYACI